MGYIGEKFDFHVIELAVFLLLEIPTVLFFALFALSLIVLVEPIKYAENECKVENIGCKASVEGRRDVDVEFLVGVLGAIVESGVERIVTRRKFGVGEFGSVGGCLTPFVIVSLHTVAELHAG